MPISFEVQRTLKMADICALYMALCKLCGPSEIFADSRGVVRAVNKGEVDCISAVHNDVDLWVLVVE